MRQKNRQKNLRLKNLTLWLAAFLIVAGAFEMASAQNGGKRNEPSESRPSVGGESPSSPSATAFDSFDNIVIPSSGVTTPYPSTINVSGMSGTISDLNVTLYNINHAAFSDLDVMLVAPDGTNMVFLSDVDLSPNSVTNLTVSFDDAAANRIALFSAPTNGVFKPTAYVEPGEGSDVFPAPAPAPSGATELNRFNGSNPNGAWRLYVSDDTPGGAGNIASGWRLTITTAPANRAAKILDFDGDGRTDYAVVRNVGGRFVWYIQRSTLGFAAYEWGANGDTLVPADYNGDGITDVAVWGVRPGSSQGFYFILGGETIPWGTTGDDARYAQDFDGDGRADPTVVRSNGSAYTWYIRQSASGGSLRSAAFGGNSFGDLPMRGDFDGDGRADIAVFRTGGTPIANTFYVLQSSSGTVASAAFGRASTDFILPADFDGDGRTDFAVWRGLQTGGDSGYWYWQNSRSGAVGSLLFGIGAPGIPPDFPMPGDYDGDGRTDQAVWRKSSSTFYVNGSASGFTYLPFGVSTDRLVAYELQVR